jgi:hypothetical protein
VLKTNLCRYPEAIGVTFQTMESDSQVAEIIYGDVPGAYQKPTQQAQCAEWLLGVLGEHEALPPPDLVTMAKEAGFSRPTLYRARRALGPRVVDTHRRGVPDNKWALAPDVAGRKKGAGPGPAPEKAQKTSEA